VSRCIFDAYRLTYFDEMMYRPALLAELNSTGEMISAVAVASDGTVAGHVALEFSPGDRAIADVAAAVTRRSWRGHGVAEHLFAYLVAEAQRRQMAGVWCDAVTVHPFTQRLAHKLGFVPCGFHLAFEPPSTRFFGIADRPTRRGSSVVMFRALSAPSTAPLDVPARHRRLVAAIYARLGAQDRLDGPPPAAGPTPGETVLGVQDHEILRLTRLTIAAPGTDVRERLRRELDRVREQEIKLVETRLNLQAPGAAATADELEGLGFMVTGVLPGGPAADWLLLQYMNGVMIDYDGMVVDAAESQELLAAVRAGDPGVR
jgi:serine/threonine-protein kinase RsbW